VLDEVLINNHRPTFHKSLVICDNHLEAFSKGSVFQMLQCRVPLLENTRLSKLPQELPATIAVFEASDHLYFK